MSQEGAHQLIFDALADFPAQCILTRVSLLGALLDLMGSPLLGSLSGLDGDMPGHPAGVDSSGIVTPVSVIVWLQTLLRKAQRELDMQLEGTLCSGIQVSQDAESEESAQHNASMAARMVYFTADFSC